MNKWILGLFVVSTVVMVSTVSYVFTKKHPAYNKNSQLKLVVYTHSSFMSSFGPGPELAQRFAKICNCKVEYVNAGGAGLLKQRLLNDRGTQVDVVLGAELLTLYELAKGVKFRPLNFPVPQMNPQIAKYTYDHFAPYEWSPMTFIHKGDKPKEFDSIKDYIQNPQVEKVYIQDPEESTPGLKLFHWLYSKNIHSLVADKFDGFQMFPSWSAAYGLFTKSENKSVYSFITSLAYHAENEKEKSFSYTKFKAGHTFQVDYAGVPDMCRSCKLADRFVEFILEPENQKLIAQKNYMLPAVDGVELPESFNKLPQLELIELKNLDAFAAEKTSLVKSWKDSLKSKK